MEVAVHCTVKMNLCEGLLDVQGSSIVHPGFSFASDSSSLTPARERSADSVGSLSLVGPPDPSAGLADFLFLNINFQSPLEKKTFS
jgi:hypothetical protein